MCFQKPQSRSESTYGWGESGPQSQQAAPSPQEVRRVTHCTPYVSVGEKGMSANPLQGIQVINSVNPCSSTPLHRPIYPYHYRGSSSFPVPSRPSLFSGTSERCYPLARSSSLHLPHPSTWNLDSPLPGSTHPSPPRLQEKVENCDYKDFPAHPRPLTPRRAATPVPNPPFPLPSLPPTHLVLSQFLTPFVVSSSSRNPPVASLAFFFFFFFSHSFPPFNLFVLFSISHSFQHSDGPSHS